MKLNNHLQPENAPVTKSNGDRVNAFDFGQNIGRNSVTQTKIKNLSLNSAVGGTLTLNPGMQVNNAGSTPIIDTLGLNSTNNFLQSQVFNGAASLTTASNSFV